MPTTPFDCYGSPLLASDYEQLAHGYVTREIADTAYLRRVTNTEGKEIIGRRDSGNYAGIVFPYVWPGESRIRAQRLRRDTPPFEIHAGQRREKDKYMSALGYGNFLYFHPLTAPESLSDTRYPLVFVEGQKKCLATFRLSFESRSDSAEIPDFVPVGLNGVWGWKDHSGKTTSATGNRVSVSGPISDLNRIEYRGRKTFILFDTDVHTNPKVAGARNALAQELTSRGAEVYLVDLPVEDGINGIDDFLGKNGPAPAMRLFESASMFDPNERLARLHYTDLGNEQAFDILHGQDFLYNWTTEQWLKWDGTIWCPDSTGLADRAMVAVAVARLQATEKIQDDAGELERTGDARQSKKRATAAALKLQNTNNRRKALESARTNRQFARKAEDFDQYDLILACKNGVIDLRNAEFRAGRREDMITNAAAASWIPDATCERWLKFLSEIFPGRPEIIGFLRRAVGYSLTGLTREEVFFILYGLGRNGKGTFLRVLLALLGDYAATAEFSTLIADRDRAKGPRNDIAALAGKRFVTAQESREGAQFDESLVKTLTGGDLITARFLHKEFFTFRPSWKIWLATNHKPEIRGTDTGIWSRPKLIPFTVSFDGREDRDLKNNLLAPSELSGILRWAVEGCREYLADGLKYPEEVLQATEIYRKESDLVEQFIAECCLLGPDLRARARPLYQDFAKWAEGTGGMTETAFGRRMKDKGFGKLHGQAGKQYLGIAPMNVKESPPESES